MAVSGTVRRAMPSAGRLVLVLALAALVLNPIIRAEVLAFDNGGQGFSSAFAIPGLWSHVLVDTVILSVGSVLIAFAFGVPLAFAVASLPRHSRILRSLPVLPLVVPSVANVIGWQFMLAPGPGYLNGVLRELPWWNHDLTGPVNVYSMTWITIITGFNLASFVYLFVSSGLSNVDRQLIEASRACGATRVSSLFRTTLPLLRPTLVYAGGICLILANGQFTGPLILGANSGINVFTTEIYSQTANVPVSFSTAAALASPLVLLGVLVLIFQSAAIAGPGRFATHTGRGFAAVGRYSRLAAGAIIGYSVVALLVPVCGLLLLALSPYWSSTVMPSRFTTANFSQVFGNSDIISAAWSTVELSLIGSALALVLGYFVANCYMSSSRVFAKAAEFLAGLPLVVPAVVFGLGFLTAYSQAPVVLYGSRALFVIAYITLMLPFASRLLLAARMSLGSAYTEAARSCGAGWLRIQLRVMLPLLRRPALSGFVLMFILLTHEFAASVLIAEPQTQVMGTELYHTWSYGNYPLAAALALVVSFATGLVIVVALAVSGQAGLTEL